jgi:hypothetical protein
VSFAAIIVCVASRRVFIVVSLYFVTDLVRKLLDARKYIWVFVLSDAECKLF